MLDATVYRKTSLGAAELAACRGTLPQQARRVLILLDGQRTLAELTELLGGQDVREVVAQLQQRGFAREIGPDGFEHTAPGQTALGAAVAAAPDETERMWNTTAGLSRR